MQSKILTSVSYKAPSDLPKSGGAAALCCTPAEKLNTFSSQKGTCSTIQVTSYKIHTLIGQFVFGFWSSTDVISVSEI